MSTSMTEFVGHTTRAIKCSKHGDSIENGYFGKWFGCAQCSAEKREADAKNEQELKKQQFVDAANIPPLFKNIGFKQYQVSDARQTKVVARLRDYAKELIDGGFKNLVLAGATGTGKTHLACAIGQNLLSNGKRVKYIASSEFAAEIRMSWDAKTRTKFESEIIEKFGDVFLLLIDEVGVNDMMKHDIWSALIDRRYRQKLPTILTTNLDEPALIQLLGDRASDRLLPNALWANCVWSSYRQVVSTMERI